MNDPHVDELVYHIETGKGLNFQDPPPLEDETDAFLVILNDGVATFSMKEHHPTEDSARQAVEEYLRARELDVALQYDSSELRFVFDRPKIVNRDPPPPPPRGTPQTVELEAAAIAVGVGSVDLIVHRRQNPRPPSDFVADTDATTMWEQYERYKQGRDRLLPMAYSCLARLEYRARNHPAKGNKRIKASSMYRVDYEVLVKLGELTNTLGDEVEACKLTPQSQLRAPTTQEIKCIWDRLLEEHPDLSEYVIPWEKLAPEVRERMTGPMPWHNDAFARSQREALENATPEERHARYRELELRVDARSKDELEVTGIVGREMVYICDPLPRRQRAATTS